MFRWGFEKFLITILIVACAFETSLVSYASLVKAEDSDVDGETFAFNSFDGDPVDSQPKSLSDNNNLPGLEAWEDVPGSDAIKSNLSYENTGEANMGIALDEYLSDSFEPKLVLNYDDQNALLILYRLSGSSLMPDFEDELEVVSNLYPKSKSLLSPETQIAITDSSIDGLTKLKIENLKAFNELIKATRETWLKDTDNIKSLVMHDPQSLVDITGKKYDDIATILSDYKNIEAATDQTEVRNKYESLMAEANEIVNSIKIDKRVLKMLVYLVTPKDQGGAGHWRIKVKRILAGYTSKKKQLSRESDSILNEINNTVDEEEESRTAADFGQNREVSSSNTTSASDNQYSVYDLINKKVKNGGAYTLITEENGDQFDAVIEKAHAADESSSSDTEEKELERNISAHTAGQAVDISEIDDIRCTMIKRVRIGHSPKSKFSQRPIKLEWQTQQGYADSGAAAELQQDMATAMRTMANESMRNLLDEFGGDITDYDGDLSSSNFNDVAMIIGKSIFSSLINSSGGSLSGYSFGDTLEKLGGMYFADLLGLPRDMFVNRRYSSYEEFEEAVGGAAIEQRMKLPLGTFSGENLDEMLLKVGQRKIEYEMNLNAGDLDQYFKDINQNLASESNKNYIVGKAVIEKELNLEKGSYSGEKTSVAANFQDLKRSIGKYKSDVLFKDANYIDTTLHLEQGTAEKLISGTISPMEFASLVGRKRLDDSAYGFQYLAARDNSFEIPLGTFQKIIAGDKEALITLGIQIISRNFTDTSIERQALTYWIKSNRNSDSCAITDPVKITNLEIHTYKKDDNGNQVLDGDGNPIIEKTEIIPETVIKEDRAISAGLGKGDLFNLFGCKESNAHAVLQKVGSRIIYYAVIQQALNPEQKIKLNLTEVNPQFTTSDPKLEFYLNRVYLIPQIINQIKVNWEEEGNNPQYLAAKELINQSITNIETLFNASFPVYDIASAKNSAKNVAIEVGRLKTNLAQTRSASNAYINKINGTLIDINELYRTVAEIIEGKEIAATDTMQLNEIESNILSSLEGETNIPVMNSNSSSKRVGRLALSRQTFMLLLARKVSPTDLFMSLASEKIENELGLPFNSLYYYVQNYESKGLGSKDSFYSAVGQARIEEEFDLPEFYFQGPVLSGASIQKPDFQNRMDLLRIYLDESTLETYKPKTYAVNNGPMKAYAADSTEFSRIEAAELPAINLGYKSYSEKLSEKLGGITLNDDLLNAINNQTSYNNLPTDQRAAVDNTVNEALTELSLRYVKYDNPKEFERLVKEATKNFEAQIDEIVRAAGGSEMLEWDIDDVILNIETYNLNDKIRTPENDLIFRLGLTGSFSALQSGNSVAWSDNISRAEKIDSILGIQKGSTKALITNGKVPSSAKNVLSTKEKQLLSAKMGISPVAIEKLNQALNGEISFDEINDSEKGAAIDITSIGDNPYIKNTAGGDDCQTVLTEVDGKLVSSVMINGGYIYFDLDGLHIFGTKQQASNYANNEHADRRATYLDEIAMGIAKIYPGKSAESIKDDISRHFTQAEDEMTITVANPDEAAVAAIQKNGINIETYNKIFNTDAYTNYKRPLVSFKIATGKAVVEKTITSRMFSSIGVRIDSDLFSADTFYEIMNGNYQSFWNIAGSMLDRELGIPQGSTGAILNAPSARSRTCALAEIGGNILGRYVGLDYISMKGNIYENMGRANIEKTLGIARNSFVGKDVDQLISNIGEINFILAFDVPVADYDLDPMLGIFYDPAYVRSISSFGNLFKLKKLNEYLSINSNLALSQTKKATLDTLKVFLHQKTLEYLKKIGEGGEWRGENINPDSGVRKQDIAKFIYKVDSLDITFGLKSMTTANMLSETQATSSTEQTYRCSAQGRLPIASCDGQNPPAGCTCTPNKNVTVTNSTSTTILPKDYLLKVSQNTITKFGALAALDLFDFNLSESQKESLSDILTNFPVWTRDKTEGYANIYDRLSSVASFDLDDKAGFSEGTVRRIIEHPDKINDILAPEAMRKIDQMINLDPSEKWSFTGVYMTYFNAVGDRSGQQEEISSECQSEYDAAIAAGRWTEREAKIQNWLIAQDNYSVLADTRINANTTFQSVVQISDPTSNPEYTAKSQELTRIKQEKQAAEDAFTNCKINHRTTATTRNPRPGGLFDWTSEVSMNKAYTILADWGSEKIREKILEVTKGTINMPTEDIKELFINGDMRYFNAAATSYTLNVYINKLNDDNSEIMPAAYRMSYDDLKLWLIGDEEAEQFAAEAAASSVFKETDTPAYEDILNNGSFGDICEEGGVFGCLGTQEFYLESPAPGVFVSQPSSAERNTSNLRAFNSAQIQRTYGAYDPSDAEYGRTTTNYRIEAMRYTRDSCNILRKSYYPEGSSQKERNNKFISEFLDDSAFVECDRNDEQLEAVEREMAAARRQSQQLFATSAQYKMYDSVLWQFDHNITPGFTYALTKGSSRQKNIAIASYIRTSLKNHELFGQKISFLETIGDADSWIKVVSFANELSTSKPADDVLLEANQIGTLDFISNYISRQSEKAFGFSIPADYAKGLVVSLSTGDFGFTTTSPNHSITRNGKEFTFETLGGCFNRNLKEQYSDKAFSWADRQLGMKPGTAKQIYDTGKSIYDAADKVKQIGRIEKAMAAGDIAKANDLKERYKDAAQQIEKAGGNTKVAKNNAKEQYAVLIIKLVSDQLTAIIQRTFGESLAELEEKWGLVPGSTMILIGAAVETVVTLLAHSAGLVGEGIVKAIPGMQMAAVVMFIATNLFGVYKIEIKCSADGYYPVLQSPSVSQNLDNESGLGVWDGKDTSTSQKMSIAAAQYKAKTLIYDVLNMNKNPLYKDVIPSQIMTGREEDVKEMNQEVANNICGNLSKNMPSISGICNGNTRAGLWSNPQTIAYTHIGF